MPPRYRSVKLETSETSEAATARFVFRASQLPRDLVQRVVLPFAVPERTSALVPGYLQNYPEKKTGIS